MVLKTKCMGALNAEQHVCVSAELKGQKDKLQFDLALQQQHLKSCQTKIFNHSSYKGMKVFYKKRTFN